MIGRKTASPPFLHLWTRDRPSWTNQRGCNDCGKQICNQQYQVNSCREQRDSECVRSCCFFSFFPNLPGLWIANLTLISDFAVSLWPARPMGAKFFCLLRTKLG